MIQPTHFFPLLSHGAKHKTKTLECNELGGEQVDALLDFVTLHL